MGDKCNYPVLISCNKLRSELANTEKIQINSEKFTFGRRPSNSVVIPSLSRYHCTFEKSATDSWIIKDESSDGIKVNGNSVGCGKSISLSDGDIITLDKSTKYVYKFMNKDESQVNSKQKEMEVTKNNPNATVNAKDIVDNKKIKFDELQRHKMERVEQKMQSLFNGDEDTFETPNKLKKLENPAMSIPEHTNFTRNAKDIVIKEKDIQTPSTSKLVGMGHNKNALTTQKPDLNGQNKTGRLSLKKQQADSTGEKDTNGLKRKILEQLPNDMTMHTASSKDDTKIKTLKRKKFLHLPHNLTTEGAKSETEIEADKQKCKKVHTSTSDSSTGSTNTKLSSNIKQADTTSLQVQKLPGEIDNKKENILNNLTPQTVVKDNIETEKSLEESVAKLTSDKCQLEKTLEETVRTHNKRKTKLLKKIGMLKKKIEKEREDRNIELQAITSTKEEMIKQLEDKVKKQDEICVKNTQELEVKCAEVADIKIVREQKNLAEQQLYNFKILLIQQDLQAEFDKLKTEDLIHERIKKVEAENKIKIANLTRERKAMVHRLNETQASYAQLLQELLDAVSQRESQLTSLSAERLQQQEIKSTKLISELRQQLEEVKNQLQTAEKDRESLLGRLSESLDSSRQSVLSEVEGVFESELECSICTEIFVNAIILNCSHSFCEYCITVHKDSSHFKPGCPLCRTEIVSVCKNLTLNSFIDKMVASFSEEMKKKREEFLEARQGEVAHLNLANGAASRTRTMVAGSFDLSLISRIRFAPPVGDWSLAQLFMPVAPISQSTGLQPNRRPVNLPAAPQQGLDMANVARVDERSPHPGDDLLHRR